MNPGSTVVPALDSILEIPFGSLVSLKAEPERNERSEPSISTDKFISITNTNSNVVQNSKEIVPDKELLRIIEKLNELIEMIFSEQSKSNSTLFDIKTKCETSIFELNCVNPDKIEIVIFEVKIICYQQFCLLEISKRKLMDKLLGILLNRVHKISSGDEYVAYALQKLNLYTQHVTSRQQELKCRSLEIQALLDVLSNKLSSYGE